MIGMDASLRGVWDTKIQGQLERRLDAAVRRS